MTGALVSHIGSFVSAWFALGLFYAVCVILGTVRASGGRDFRYPLTVRVVS